MHHRPTPPAARATGLLLATVFTPAAYAATLQVPAQYPTIADAETAAVDGDTIQLAPIRFQEAVSTAKRLRFVGTKAGGDQTTWDGFFSGSDHDQLTATADGVEVVGIVFEHGGTAVTITGDDAVLEKCRFRSCATGAFVDGARARVSKNRFTGLDSANPWAVEVLGADATVQGNRIELSRSFGLHVDAEFAGTATIAKNRFESNLDNIGTVPVRQMLIEAAAAPMIKKNRMRDCGYMSDSAVAIRDCDDAQVIGNVVENLSDGLAAGIEVLGDRATLRKNVLESLASDGSVRCMWVDGADAVIEKNRILSCYADGDVFAVFVTGAGAAIRRNDIDSCNGGGDAFGALVLGDGAEVRDNEIDDLHGEVDSGDVAAIHVTGHDAVVDGNEIRELDGNVIGIGIEGDRAAVVENHIAALGDSNGISVNGDDFTVRANTVDEVAANSVGIVCDGAATTPGAVQVIGNRVSNVAGWGISCHTDSGRYADNVVTFVSATGFFVQGDGNELIDNEVSDTADDAYRIVGDQNTLLRCVARRSDKDGFDVDGNQNVLEKCRAEDCAAEGLDNGGTSVDTVVRKCVLTGSRIDYAGDGAVAEDVGNTYVTGGPGAVPEID